MILVFYILIFLIQYHFGNKAVEIFDWENWILPNSSFDEYLEQFPRADVRQGPHDDHPNKLGHQKWFEVVSEKINSMNIL